MNKLFSSYTKTIRRMLKRYDPELSNLFYDQNIEENWITHDNWNGGIDFYNIILKVPVDYFENLRRRGAVKETENAINGYYKDAMRGEDESLQISGVILKPSDDDITILGDNIDDSMWRSGQFRLFISHLSANKTSASNLKSCLSGYGIDCFVAHEDITPSKEWEIEIEKALFTMDALCAIVAPGFINSHWCDQEVGIALGQKKLVISINKGAVPYGFFGKYQALASKDKKANDIAKDIWKAVYTNDRTRPTYMKKLISLILNATNASDAMQFIEVLKKCHNVDKQFVEVLHEKFGFNKILSSQDVLISINHVFQQYGLTLLTPSDYISVQNDYNELPF